MTSPFCPASSAFPEAGSFRTVKVPSGLWTMKERSLAETVGVPFASVGFGVSVAVAATEKMQAPIKARTDGSSRLMLIALPQGCNRSTLLRFRANFTGQSDDQNGR